MADPTAKILNQFGDKSAWDEIVAVPIFVAHKVTHKDGTEVTVDDARLEKICENINTRFKDRRVPVVFTEGHRVPTFPFPEKDQPDILAYGKDAFIDDWEGEPALWIYQYVLKGCGEKVKKYPFRSPEFRCESDQITGVGLLKRDPKLDMGVVLYQQLSPNIYSYQAEDGTTCLYMENTMPDLTNDDKGLETTPPAPPAPGGGFLDEFKKAYPKFDELYAKMCGDSVTTPPPAGGGGGGGDMDPTMSYQRDQVPPALAKQIAELKERADRADASAKRIKARQVITNLRTVDGLYMDDPKGEEDMLFNLPEDAWPPHVRRLKVNYQRDPAAGPMIPVSDATRDADGDPEPATARESEQVVHYAEQNGIDATTDVGWKRAKVEYYKSKRQRVTA